jgi:acyl-CoA synthetase (AMP-forming)/AMP-acid ligase II
MVSGRPDITFRSIPRMARMNAARFGSRRAVVDQDAVLSFADVNTEMLRVSAALIAGGVEPGDRVAVWAPNSAGWMVAALGILATGAWLVPVNTRYRGAEASYILAKTDARTLFTTDPFLGTDYRQMLREAAPDLRALSDVVILPPSGRYGGTTWERFLERGRDVPASAVQDRLDAISPDDVSDVIFTSGTTGTPKGVMLRHGASLRGFGVSYNNAFQLGEGDRHLVATPFSHCFGYKAGWMLSLLMGATTYPVATFDAGKALRLIDHERITHMPGAPTHFFALLDHPDRERHDLSSLRRVLLAASIVPPELVHRLRDEIGLKGIVGGYGLTENHATGTMSDPGDPVDIVATTVGKPVDGIEVKIVDEANQELVQGQAGEILLRGYAHMTGYFDDAAATAEAFVDGWLRTGDIGLVDERGYVRVTDRKKDIYIMGGFNVSPAEVENLLLKFPKIEQVAVVGVPDQRFGQVGMAFVIPRPGLTVTAEEVIEYAREHIANYKVPRRVEIVSSFPLNATGKVLKTELRQLATRVAAGTSVARADG